MRWPRSKSTVMCCSIRHLVSVRLPLVIISSPSCSCCHVIVTMLFHCVRPTFTINAYTFFRCDGRYMPSHVMQPKNLSHGCLILWLKHQTPNTMLDTTAEIDFLKVRLCAAHNLFVDDFKVVLSLPGSHHAFRVSTGRREDGLPLWKATERRSSEQHA